jgi:hypothetical protein
MPTTQPIAETDEGRIELKGNEERLIDKTSGDPVAWRAISANGGIAKWSICTEQDVEIGYLFGKRDERYPGQAIGEFQFWLKAPGMKEADRHVLSIRHDGLVCHVGANAGTAPSSFLRSPNGQYEMEIQDDGNVVVYDEQHGHIAVSAFRLGFGL